MKQLKNGIKRNPGIVFTGVMSFIIISLLFTVLFDIINVFGVKNIMVENLDVPYFWWHWWGTPFDFVQFYFLGFGVMVMAINAGMTYERGDRHLFYFWGLLSIGMVLLTIEDASDIRSVIRMELIEKITGEGKYGFFGTVAELLHFAVLGVFMLYPVIRYRDVILKNAMLTKYFIIGYVSYAISQISSWAGSAFGEALEYNDLYQIIGDFLMPLIFVRNDLTQLALEKANEAYPWFNFYLADRIWEESFELMGMGGIITAGVIFFVQYRKNKE